MADGSRNYTSRRYKLEDNSLGHDKFRVRLSSTNIFSEQFSKVYHYYIGIIKQNQKKDFVHILMIWFSDNSFPKTYSNNDDRP